MVAPNRGGIVKTEHNKSRRPKETGAVARAYFRCRDALARSIVKMRVRPEDVDDILHETFVKTYTANQKTPLRSPEDYLFVVSRNLAIRDSARRSRELQAVIDDALTDAQIDSLDSQIHEQRKCEALARVIHALPDKKRRAVLLRKVYGFSACEIAAKMACSKSSVDKYIASGIKECEEKLHAQGYDFATRRPGETSEPAVPGEEPPSTGRRTVADSD